LLGPRSVIDDDARKQSHGLSPVSCGALERRFCTFSSASPRPRSPILELFHRRSDDENDHGRGIVREDLLGALDLDLEQHVHDHRPRDAVVP